MTAEHDIPGDRLIQRRRLQTVGARQVQQTVGATARGANETAFLALHSDAGVVGDFLAAARETVEQRGLAAVGNPDERQREAGGAGCSAQVGRASSTQMFCASQRRSAN